MFYLCSIGSNLDPAQHVSQAVEELLARFGQLRLSSVIQTTPVGMRSHHDISTACSSSRASSPPPS